MSSSIGVEPDFEKQTVSGNLWQNPITRPPQFSMTSVGSALEQAAQNEDKSCLITLTPFETGTVETCHVIRRSTPLHILLALQSNWNMHGKELNPDATANIIFLTGDIHILFNRQGWFLLPEPKVIDELYDIYFPKDKSKACNYDLSEYFVGRGRFIYYMVPLHLMETSDYRLLRREVANPGGDWPVHRFPYDRLGPLQSSLHPHFAIMNAGSKLVVLNYRNQLALLDWTRKCLGPDVNASKVIRRVIKLYKKWTEAHGVHFGMEQIEKDGGNYVDDSDDSQGSDTARVAPLSPQVITHDQHGSMKRAPSDSN